MVVTNSVPRVVVENDQLDENFDSPDGESYSNWMDYAIPVDSVGLTPFAANVVEDKETPPFPCKLYESPSPESTSVSDTSDFGHVKDVDKDMNKAWQHCDDCASESTGSCSDSFEQVCGSCEYSHTSPESSRLQCSPCRRLLRVGSLECIYRRYVIFLDSFSKFIFHKNVIFHDDYMNSTSNLMYNLLVLKLSFHCQNDVVCNNAMKFHFFFLVLMI